MPKKPKRVREQVMVYLTAQDRALLERLVQHTGLARTELLRQGLYQLASRSLATAKPGSAIEHLIESASTQDVPPDLSARADDYLYGGGYERWFGKGRFAKPRTGRKKTAARPR